MPAIRNFSAWVEVDGKKLPEYQVESSEDGSKVTCWIPSEAGKQFKVIYQDIFRDVSTRTSLTIDGVRCQGKILLSRDADPKHHNDVLSHRGMSTSRGTFQRYVFSNCRLVEDELDQLSNNISALGDIVVTASEVLLGKYVYRRSTRREGFPELQIHERAKKGIVHGTQLGEPEPRREKPAMTSKRLRDVGQFIFKYRPMDVLMANNIAPPLQAPAPSKSSSKVIIDLTLDDDEPSNKTRVKKEIKQEKSIIFDNTIIDLTI